MEKEHYIDQVKNSSSIYAKVEELAILADLPITIEGNRIKYGFDAMKREENTYYYKNDSKSVFIFLDDARVKLALFDNELAEVYDVDLEHDNTLQYYSYNNGKLTEANITSKRLKFTSSNNITNEFKAFLSEIGVKLNFNHDKKVEYCSFEFILPKIIENDHKIKDPFIYIPGCQATIINNNMGKIYSSEKNIYSVDYQEGRFRLTSSIFRNDILAHFAVTSLENEVHKRISSPKNIEDISTIVKPLRHNEVKRITDSIIFDPKKEEFTKYLVRYYDEIIHALKYFQNEDLDKFYVFEDDLNRLQLK